MLLLFPPSGEDTSAGALDCMDPGIDCMLLPGLSDSGNSGAGTDCTGANDPDAPGIDGIGIIAAGFCVPGF